MSAMVDRIEAALAEVIAERGSKELASAFGLFLADHHKTLGRAVIEAMREPTQEMLEVGEASPYTNHALRLWRQMIDASIT